MAREETKGEDTPFTALSPFVDMANLQELLFKHNGAKDLLDQ